MSMLLHRSFTFSKMSTNPFITTKRKDHPMNQNQLDQKRNWIKGKFIVGIDPAKDKH